MKCIIVDDEPLARELLTSYAQKVEGLRLLGTYCNAIEAFSALQHHQVDLMFLDIKMPQITGLDLIRSLKNPPQVILTTAYREYAYEAFDLDVVDYLLKPILFERFLRAISKIHQIKQPAENEEKQDALTKTYEDAYIYLKQDREMVKIFLKDILYIESLRDYVRVKTTLQQVISYQRISYLEEKLPDSKFLRIHRSYIIALDKVVSFTPQTVNIGKQNIPIGRYYKNETLKVMNRDNVLCD